MDGKRLKKLRIANGMTQTDLAEKLNITYQTVGNWEQNVSLPSIDILKELTKIFGVTSDYLLGLDQITSIDANGLTEEQIGAVKVIIDFIKK